MTYPTISPELTLDFAKSEQLDPRITFSRLSIATYVDSDGLIKTAPDGVARFKYDSDGKCLGLLIEEARTNSLEYSVDFSQQFATYQSSITANSTVAPDGTSTATTLIEDTSTNYFHLISGYTGVPQNGDGTHTFSVFAKAKERSAIALSTARSTGQYAAATFDLSSGVVSQYGGTNDGNSVDYVGSSIISIGNGWYRCTLTYSSVGDVWPSVEILNTPTYTYGNFGRHAYNGDGTSGVYIWGVQMEQDKDFPSSYIPTNGTPGGVTRAVDLATMPTAGIFGDDFTTINKDFGAAGGSDTLTIVGPNAERTVVYPEHLTQAEINKVAAVDDFWRWRVIGSSFALPSFTTDGQVTVDWGDGTVEVLTTSEHTFTNGGGYHEIGFRLDSGTKFRPYVGNNASHDTKVVAVGPAPESMILDGNQAFNGCSNLEAFDATVDITTSFSSTWRNCSSLTSFPFIDIPSVTSFPATWSGCSSLTSFPLIDTSSGTSFNSTWNDCSSLTSFPLIDTSSGTDFRYAWQGCSSLTSFPLIDTSSATTLYRTWSGSGLTSFPLLDTSSVTNFGWSWRNCNSLATFPLIDTSSGTEFVNAWLGNIALTTFPALDFSSATTLNSAWSGCTSLANYPANMFDTTGTLSSDAFANAFRNCALTVQSVENILVSLDTNGASNITLTLSGGTSAGQSTWTSAATTAYNNLVTKGWTITARP